MKFTARRLTREGRESVQLFAAKNINISVVDGRVDLGNIFSLRFERTDILLTHEHELGEFSL